MKIFFSPHCEKFSNLSIGFIIAVISNYISKVVEKEKMSSFVDFGQFPLSWLSSTRYVLKEFIIILGSLGLM